MDDNNFEAEYDNVRELSIAGVNLLHELREKMENQMDLMNKSKTLNELTSRKDEFEEMTGQVSSGQRTLAGTQKYLMTDFTPAMRSLQETLAKYSRLLQDRLKKEMVTYKVTDAKVKGATSVELVGMRSQAESQKQLTDLAKALKELEKQVAECDQNLIDLTLLTNDALKRALQIEEDLRKGQAEADRKYREEEEKSRKEEEEKEKEKRKREEEEEDKRRKEEEERRRKEEEERLRLEADRLAKLSEEDRLKEEEEKRMKREEEERLRLEEEERLRREDEERLRLEEEERPRQGDEERLRLKEEERLKFEEEERLKREEEERLRLEEEGRLKREEEERLRLEEEERLRKEEEERVKREEEERLKREEEEERLRIEEEERRRTDPRCWKNVIEYEIRDEVDAVGYGVACIIRAPEDVVLKKDDIDCTVIDMPVNPYPLSEHEELVSNLINLRPSNGTKLTFENDVWLALPYPQNQRTREMKMRIQKLSPEGDAANNAWEDAETQETTIQGQEPITKYVHTRLCHLPADGINITVITRLRKDSQQFNNKGGRLVSSVDPRVAIQVPRNAFRLTVEISLQIILVDSSAISELKGRYDGCENIIGSSPIVCLGCGHSPQQPLNFFITNPFGGRLKRPVTVATEVKAEGKGKKESNLPRVSNVNGPETFVDSTETEIVVLLTKDVNGKWRIRQEVALNFERDSTHFGLKELAERFLLLRISQNMEPSLLSRIAQDLENSLKERPATIIVRQDVDDNATMYVEVCKSDNINKVMQKLKNDKFTDGPATQGICLREGDVIEVSFSPMGNIDFDDRTPRRFTFNSNLASSKLTTEIKERDVYAQKASETYKGHLRISLVDRDYEPPTKFQSKGDQRDVDKKQIAELLLSLPKLPKEFSKVNRILFPITNRGPLTEEYFNHLTDELGDEWFIVADRLKFTKAAIQRITGCYGDLGTSDATDKSIKHMLTDWFKTSSTSIDKVEDLQMALMEAGRNDLAEELAAKNKEFRQELEERLEETNLRKITHAFCGSQAAVKSWKKVAKALGLNQNDILAIEGADTETVTPEMVETMLKRWKENNGRSANKESLVVCLQNLKLTEAASRVGLVR